MALFLIVNQKKWGPVAYDLTDEMGGMKAGFMAFGTKLKDSYGKNTFQGDMRALSDDYSNKVDLQKNINVFLGYYKNQPKAQYNHLLTYQIDNNVVKRIKTAVHFIRPHTPRIR